MTDRDGDIVQQYGYTAFGAENYKNNTLAFDVTNRYTGQQIDEDTGLYFYQSRYYDPKLARFTQADTIVPSSTTSQALNRYTYVKNNPLKFTDPLGHGWESFVKKWVGAIVGIALDIFMPGLGTLFIAVISSGVSTLVNGGGWKSFAIGVGIGIAAGEIGGAVGGWAANSGNSLLAGLAANGIAQAAFMGAAGGALISIVYGQNVGRGLSSGVLGGLTGFAVSAAANAAISYGGSVIKDTDSQETGCTGSGGAGGAGGGPTEPLVPQVDIEDLADFAQAWAVGERITIWDEKVWNTYVDGVRDSANLTSKWKLLTPLKEGDTFLDNNHKLFYIVSLGKVSRGYEINYILQGMIYNRHHIYNKTSIHIMTKGWKTGMMAAQSIRNKKEWNLLPNLFKGREPYRPLSRDELYFTKYGFEHYKN